MVTEESLEALDLLIWLRSEKAAAQLCFCSQSAISRRIGATLKIFRLQLSRHQGEIVVLGNSNLLALERQVHQLARLQDFRPLRLEATHFFQPLLQRHGLERWTLGSCDHRGTQVMHGLLEDRIIDAWISSDLFDLPDESHPTLTSIGLMTWPGYLVAANSHPLARVGGVTRGDIDRFPVLEIPELLYPSLASKLNGVGLGSHRERMNRYDRGSWNGLSRDAVTLTYGGPFLPLSDDLQRIDWSLGLDGGEALVVRRDLLDQPAIALLLEQLQRLIAHHAARDPLVRPVSV